MEKNERGAHGAGMVSFDLGVVVAAAVLSLVVRPGELIAALSTSGIAVICAIVAAVIPFSLIRQHERVRAVTSCPAYAGAVALAIRLVGFLMVLGMLFVIPLNLKRGGIVPDFLDDLLFVVGLLAMLGGVLAGFGNRGAGLVMALGAALLGLAFCLPGDVRHWLDGSGAGPAAGIAAAAVALGILIFVGRFVNRLDELSGALDAWMARPSGGLASRIAFPFLCALAFSLWNVLYVDLFVSRIGPGLAIPALFALGIVPYRILLVVSPPLRALPVATGLLALGAYLMSALR
jgi:hypothetical protein